MNNGDFDNTINGTTMHGSDKKCPNCGGVMVFDPASGMLKCPYCDSVFDITPDEEDDENGLEQDLFSAEFTDSTDWGTATRTIICKFCGGESVYDANTLATECPFCGSNQVMETDADSLAPFGVCTFKISKEKAASKFSEWIRKKLFCPSKAKKNCTPETFRGVYVPLWTFDTDTISRFTARYGIDRTYRDSEGNMRHTTDWYRVSGTHREFIDDHPVLASDRYDPALFEKLLPFDTAGNLLYKPEYMEGFAAEKYSIGLRAGWETAKTSIKKLLKKNITNRILRENGADHVDNLKFNTVFDNIKYKYLLAPLWISSFRYKDKVYNFMVNGETGKTAGKAPVSPIRAAIALLIAFAILFLIWKLVNS